MMEDKIFIKEPEGRDNSGKLFLIGIAILVVLGIGAIAFVLTSNNNNDADDNSQQQEVESAPVTDDEPDGTTDEPATPDPTPTTPAPDATADPVQTKAPADPTKINIYFPKSATTNLQPVLRDKPESGLIIFTLTELLRGPSSEEKAQGFSVPWKFSGDNKCGGTSTFKYTLSGTLLKVTMCKDFTGTDLNKFIEATRVSLIEQGSASKVAVLDANGNCLGEAGSQNQCLNQ